MKTTIVALGSLLLAAIAVPGAGFMSSKVREQNTDSWVRVTTLESLPNDGTPRMFPIRRVPRDGWDLLPERTVGHVYLRRIPKTDTVRALKTFHTRGSNVVYDEQKHVFRCVCWDLEFTPDGPPVNDHGPPCVIEQLESKTHQGDVFVSWR